MTFDQHILAMAVFPAVCDPVLTPVGRLLVVARCPGIVAIVVAVIAVLPHVSFPRRRTAPFVHRRGWPDANHDLRKRCRGDQGKSKQQCHCSFLHENRVLSGVRCFGIAAQVPDGAEMSVARRILCALIVTRIHLPCTTPDFLRDVLDCSMQHFPSKTLRP